VLGGFELLGQQHELGVGCAELAGSGGTASATLTVDATALATGANTISAQYGGNTSYSGASSSVVLTVAVAPSSGPPVIASLTNGASFVQGYAPGMVLTVQGTGLAPFTQTAMSVPLPTKMQGVTATINGVPAPFYGVYASPQQLNIQIPYETPSSGTAVLVINNNGQTVSVSFPMAATAPGIFFDYRTGAVVPLPSAARGQVATLFITGAGAVTPVVATGAPPTYLAIASLPTPITDPKVVTVGGVNAPIQFIGIPAGLVGVVQVNFQIPASVSTGNQRVVVSIGGVSSPAATLTVTQ